ncbi:MAG: RNA polymerase sigma factor [Calditrichia bacterium]
MQKSGSSTLITAVKKGNAEAFQQLYYQFSDMLYRFLWRKVRNEAVAQDLVQDVFLRIWSNRANLDEQKEIKSYLYRIANNLAIDHLRKKIVRNKETIDEASADVAFYPDDWFDFEEHIQQALNKLPPGQRNVFYLSRFEGLKYQEIAQALNISSKTVENQISSALKKLRHDLKDLLILVFCFFYPLH